MRSDHVSPFFSSFFFSDTFDSFIMGIQEGTVKRRVSSSKKPTNLSEEEIKKAKNLKNRRKKLAKRSKKMQERITLKRNAERNGQVADDDEEDLKELDSDEEADTKRSKRPYEVDLELYLDNWLLHMEGTPGVWKFNKVLQSWATTHCLDKAEISTDLFKKLVPYLCTIQGAAKERLKEKVMEVAADEPTVSGATDEDILLAEAAKKSAWKRACKLLVSLQESEEQSEQDEE